MLNERTIRIVELRRSKHTYAQIGDIIGVTRERIRQILHRAGEELHDPNLSSRFYMPLKRVSKKCEVCGKIWQTIPSDVLRFCSNVCRKAYNRDPNTGSYYLSRGIIRGSKEYNRLRNARAKQRRIAKLLDSQKESIV